MRKSKLKILASILVLTCMVLIASIVIIALGKKTVDGYRDKLDEYEQEILSHRQTVYVATVDIEAGDTLEEYVNVAEQTV